MLPRTHEYWNDLATQNCIAALQKGHLVAVAWEPDLAKEHHSDASSSAYKTASSNSSRNGAENDRSNYRPRSDTPATVETIESPAKGYRDRIMSRHYQRVMERLRTLISKYYSEASQIYILLRMSLTPPRKRHRLQLPLKTKHPPPIWQPLRQRSLQMELLRQIPSFPPERPFKMDNRTLPPSRRSPRQKLALGHPPPRHQGQRLIHAVPEQPPSPSHNHSPETNPESTHPADFHGPKSRRRTNWRPDPSPPRRTQPRFNKRLRSNRH